MKRVPTAVACAVACGVFAGGLRDARAETPGSKPAAAYVLALWTDDVDDQADALTQSLRARLRQTPGWSLLEGNQSFETLAIALKCPAKPDPPCLLRIGDHLKADRFVWGTIQRRGSSGEVSAEVHMWTRGKGDAVAKQTYPDALKDPSSDPLRAVAANLLDPLTGTARSAFPQPSPAAPPPVAPAEGFAAQGPAAAPSPTPLESTPESPAAGDRARTTRNVIAYSALVVGGGLLVVSAIEAANWISDSNASSDDRKSVPDTVKDVCATPFNAAGQDACNKSRDAMNVSTLGWIFAGAGAALVGAGAALLLTGGSEAAVTAAKVDAPGPRFALVPAVGPGGGHLSLKLTF